MYKVGGIYMIKRLAVAAAAVTIAASTPAYAGQWVQDSVGWWWKNDDGSYPKNEWKWLDGVSEKYYFGPEGYMAINTTTPDGQMVDSSGAWIKDGVVQTQTKTMEWGLDNVALDLTDEEYAELEAFINGDWNKSNTTNTVENNNVEDIDPYEVAYRIIELVNQEREKRGRAPLVVNDGLMESAMLRAEEAEELAGYSHVLLSTHKRPDGSSYLTAISIDYSEASENIHGGGLFKTDTVKTLSIESIEGWLSSVGHKQNMLNDKWEETGVGVCISDKGYSVVQMFIKN